MMLLRHRSAPRSLSLPRCNTSRRPHLPPRHTPVPQDGPFSGRRLLVTRPDLAPWHRKKLASTPPYNPVTSRPLATAVDDSIRNDDIPFADGLQSAIPRGYSNSPSTPLYHLRSFDPASVLQLRLVDEPPQRLRTTGQGVPGGLEEMLSVFNACLEVGRIERAGIVLERVFTRDDITEADMIALHNQYLRAGIAQILDQPESKLAKSFHHWFDVHIQGMELPPTAETIACMLKISLLSSQGARLEKLVKRYLDMLPAESTWTVLGTGILNQQDFGTITKIYQPTSDLMADELVDLEAENGAEGIPLDASPSSEVAENQSENEGLPDVLPVPQKGLGLKTLRGVLSFFGQIDGMDLSELPSEERREIQERLEKDCVEAAIERWREEHEALAKIGQNTAISQRALNSQLYEWQCALEAKIQDDFDLFDISESREKKSQEDVERCIYGPFMRQSTPTRLAAVTIMGVLNSLAQQGSDMGAPLSALLTHLARVVEEDVKVQKYERAQAAKKKASRLARKLGTVNPTGRKTAPSSATSTAAASPTIPDTTGAIDTTDTTNTAATPDVAPELRIIEPPQYDKDSWPPLIKTKVAAQLLSALLDCAKIKVVREHPDTKMPVSQMQPALARTIIHRRGKKMGIVMANKVLVELLKREPRGDYLARHLPMLVEPQPWTRFDRGGFIQFPASILRVKNGEKDQKIYAEAAFERGDLDQVSKGLDVLGRTAWRINEPVFQVMIEAWNSGVKIANIPPLDPDIPTPAEPDAPHDPIARRLWLRQVKLAENKKSGLHSERCFMNFQLDIARAFKDQTFYFPHNMDFRGRAYPIPAYLNHMGADHVRGILRFAKGRELGENGLRWLKVQLANVFGYDKASLQERENFASEHLPDILDSATNPLTGQRWWLQAEDPWQCLAACYELKAVHESPDPTKFVSHLPVHQDGTCNGLQHYAALGGDTWGAQQVNLLPGDRPADVYSAVADLVKQGIAEDLTTEENPYARAVDGKITRKVVKQTVMTNVYGVTFVGAKAQILKQLDAAYPDIEAEAGVSPMVLASYIATKIFKGLSTMFRGAHDIQYWLGECAGRVCRALTPEQLDRIAIKYAQDVEEQAGKKARKGPKKISSAAMEDLVNQFRSTIVWTTPLRMPIVQPYRKSSVRVITTCLQNLNLQIHESSDPVNRRKQLQGFPPNFIHSLDASHMLLSALECDELGLSFAAVHDSFWTHAADVDVMNRVLRDAFIRIHSEDVIGRLASEFHARYKGSLYLGKVAKASELGKEISELRSSRRASVHEELFEERERQRLLASSDPEEVKKGKEMITPASIYEQHAADAQLASDDELTEVALGHISSNPPEDDETGMGDTETTSPLDSELLEVGEDTDIEQMQRLSGVTHFEATLKKMTAASRRKKPRVDYFDIWLPLTFPPIPVKGDFDVSKLKSSQYFFS